VLPPVLPLVRLQVLPRQSSHQILDSFHLAL
jgi:hypothetical protein